MLRGLPVIPPLGLVHERVRLRVLNPSDVVLLQQLSRDPDVVRWTSYPADLDDDQALARIERGRHIADQAVFCAMEFDGRPAGTCGAGVGAGESVVEVFYAVLAGARRQGIASTAVALLSNAARAAGARRVNLATHLDNVGSHAVAAKAGFVRVAQEHRVVKDISTTVVIWQWDAVVR